MKDIVRLIEIGRLRQILKDNNIPFESYVSKHRQMCIRMVM